MNVKIGTKVKELRQLKGITQEQLAEALGVTNQAVSKWESENGYPDIEMISQIADYFNVTIDYLFNHIKQPDTVRQKRFKIQIIDESKTFTEPVREFLEKDYEVIVTEPTHNAVEYAKKEKPDLMVLDIVMSGVLNFDILKDLKASEITRDIPVIITTHHDNPEAKKKVFDLGVTDFCFLAKPLLPEELKARIEWRKLPAK